MKLLRQLLWKQLGRWLLWVVVGLLVVRGASDLLLPRRQAPVATAASPAPAWADRQSFETHALLFSRDYLTWLGGKPDERMGRLRKWAAPAVVTRLQNDLDATARDQSVNGAWVYSSKRVTETEAHVVIAVQVTGSDTTGSPTPRWIWLAVPVARLAGGLTVVDLPTLLPAPAPADRDPPPRTGQDQADPGGEVRDLVDSFLRAYAGGTPAQLRYFLAPGATLTGLGGAAGYAGLADLQVLRDNGATQAVAEAVLTDPVSHAHLHQRFVLQIVRLQERWLIQDMQERGD